MSELLDRKTILITDGALRVGRIFTLACARAGADMVIHYGHSDEEAEETSNEVRRLRRRVWVFQTDLSDPSQAENMIPRIDESTPLHRLVNSAAIFEPFQLIGAPE